MKVAQELYEGVDIEGMGATGLITYMRTDSLRISNVAIEEVTEYIKNSYGEKFLPPKPRFFKSRSNAQDGHEAIRPSMPSLTPDSVKASLTSDQYKLYKLIWNRFTASQMADCIQKTTQADIVANGYTFKASGYRVDFEGFTTLYVESKDVEEEKTTQLPPLEKDMIVRCKELKKISTLHSRLQDIRRRHSSKRLKNTASADRQLMPQLLQQLQVMNMLSVRVKALFLRNSVRLQPIL